MENEEVKRLVNIRSFLIQEYKKLDGGTNPSTAMMRQVEAATVIEKVIKDLDSVLGEYVNFS